MSHIEIIPKELIIEIFSTLSLKNLINLESCNHSFKKIIRETKWNNLTIKLEKNIISIQYIINHYQFIKYDFSNSLITNESVKLLGNCHTLNLYGCKKITDGSVKHLGKCHTLNLYGCNQITDESVKHLGNCHTLDLRGCYQITDESVKHLGKCHTLCLSGCYQITNESVKLLGDCHRVDISGCYQFTDHMITQLRSTVKIIRHW